MFPFLLARVGLTYTPSLHTIKFNIRKHEFVVVLGEGRTAYGPESGSFGPGEPIGSNLAFSAWWNAVRIPTISILKLLVGIYQIV